MKKLILMLIAIVAVVFSSCTNTTSKPSATDTDSIAVAVDSITVDSVETVAVDTLVNE